MATNTDPDNDASPGFLARWMERIDESVARGEVGTVAQAFGVSPAPRPSPRDEITDAVLDQIDDALRTDPESEIIHHGVMRRIIAEFRAERQMLWQAYVRRTTGETQTFGAWCEALLVAEGTGQAAPSADNAD